MDEERIETYKALEKASEAFEKHLKDLGYNPSFWGIRFTAWMLTTEELTPVDKIELDTRSQADGKYHE